MKLYFWNYGLITKHIYIYNLKILEFIRAKLYIYFKRLNSFTEGNCILKLKLNLSWPQLFFFLEKEKKRLKEKKHETSNDANEFLLIGDGLFSFFFFFTKSEIQTNACPSAHSMSLIIDNWGPMNFCLGHEFLIRWKKMKDWIIRKMRSEKKDNLGFGALMGMVERNYEGSSFFFTSIIWVHFLVIYVAIYFMFFFVVKKRSEHEIHFVHRNKKTQRAKFPTMILLLWLFFMFPWKASFRKGLRE